MERKLIKTFAGDANLDEIGKFGSALLGTPINTDDIEEIQALDAWGQGWSEATISANRYPALQERNGLDKVITYGIQYLNQSGGWAEWHLEESYPFGGTCKAPGTTRVYLSLIDNNQGNNPEETPDAWQFCFDISNVGTGDIQSFLTPFSINSGPVDEKGDGNTLRFSGNTLYIDGPITATTASGKIFTHDYLEPIDMSGKPDGIYNIFVTPQGETYALSNMIYRQASKPVMNAGDVWLDFSVEPLIAVKSDKEELIDFDGVPVGSATMKNGVIASVETFPYNFNGIGKKLIESWTRGNSWRDIFLKYDQDDHKIKRWIEQGGKVGTGTTKVNFPTRFMSDDFTITTGLLMTSNVYGYAPSINAATLSEVSMEIYVYTLAGYAGAYWKAKGY